MYFGNLGLFRDEKKPHKAVCVLEGNKKPKTAKDRSITGMSTSNHTPRLPVSTLYLTNVPGKR